MACEHRFGCSKFTRRPLSYSIFCKHPSEVSLTPPFHTSTPRLLLRCTTHEK